MTADLRPLAGRRVLVTRPGDRGRPLAAILEDRGARVDLRPTIAFADPSDPAPAREAAAALDRYRWVVVSSPTAAGFLDAAARSAGRDPGASGAAFAAVGPGTARALRALGVEPAVVASRSDADGLADALDDRVRAGDRVLVVRPEGGREVVASRLAARGARVDAVRFYRTVAAPGAEAIARDVASGRYDVVVFSSPSTFLKLLEAAEDRRAALERSLAGVRRVAIGTVTAAAMRSLGLAPDAVAEAPTDAAVADAVVAAASEGL